jgi:nucleoid-associated protein YgaU
MFNEQAKSTDIVASKVASGGAIQNGVSGGGVFKVECLDKDGNLKWTAESPNLVVNVGLKDMNDKYFAGVTYSAAWYIGLYGAGASNTPAAGDTMASHAGWTEVTAYSQATRPAATFGAATTADPSVISNSASVAVFSINGTTTVGGAFLTSNNTKGGTTGTLFSASDFTSPGDRSVVNGDTLNVTYTFSLDAV